MKTYLKLCCSIVRKNLSFTLGLFVMSVLATAIAFLGANLGDSCERSVTEYLTNSRMPDALVTTELLPVEAADEIANLSGASAVYPRMAYDTHIRLANGRLYSARLFQWDENCPLGQTEYEKSEAKFGALQTRIARKFAVSAGIAAGDTVYIETPDGFCESSVHSLVSNPETLSCVYDAMSAYESSGFTYLYVRPEDMNALTGVSGRANQWLIYFPDGMSADEEKNALQSVEKQLGDTLIASDYLPESEAIRSIYNDTDTIRVLCRFLPLVIWLISLGFSFIFVRIIIINKRKMIGLLRALGYSAGRVTLLFTTYALLISLLSLTAGIPFGHLLLRTGAGAVCSASEIRELVIAINPLRTALMLLAMVLTGAFAAVLSAGTIARTDPAEVYGGAETNLVEPPAFVKRLRVGAFFKLSLTAVLRSLLRQLVGALCVCACVVIMCVGFEGVCTTGYPIDAVYGGRYTYDLMVRGLANGACERIAREVSGIARMEPATMFMSNLSGESVRVSTIDAQSRLVALEDMNGNRLFPKDGVIIDEMRAEKSGLSVGDTVLLGETPLPITGIAREILYCVQYISPETARAMGHGESNCAFITLSADANADDVQAQILKIDQNAYFARFDAQKETIRGAFFGIRLVMGIFAVLGFGIGIMLMLNMSIIDFNSNRMRFSVLRALGAKVGRLALVPVTENCFRALLGIIVAIPVCGVCTRVLLHALSNATQQYVFVEYGRCLMLSCMIPCVFVLLSVASTVIRIRRLKYLDDLNGVE